jgi:FkbM family methyltransferase
MALVRPLRFIVSHPLNRGSEFQSVLRFIKWQLGSRLVGGAAIVNWIGGSRFLVRTGEKGITGNIYTGLQEFEDMGYLLHVLRDSDLFVDVGANVGSYTVLACAAVGASGYAFEPVPSTYNRLVENVRLNRMEARVTCLNVGVGHAEYTTRFTSALDVTNHVATTGEDDKNMIDVRICTLDAVLKHAAPSLAKIDVEGFEMPVLEGAQEILKKQSLHSVIMELNGSGMHYGYDESRIMQMMLDHGFHPHSYDPFKRRLIDLGGKTVPHGNTIFVRNLTLVKERIASAGKVRVNGKEF